MRINKIMVATGLVFSALVATSQGPVEAELAFAKHAKDQSVKKAFLSYADSSAVVYGESGFMNAIETWNKTPEFDGLLEWYPVFSAIALSGELAFNTGPFTYRASASDTVSGHGQFNTIWRKDNKGEWKFLLDLGAYTLADSGQRKLRFATGFTTADDHRSIAEIDSVLISGLKQKGSAAYLPYLDNDSWFNVNGFGVMAGNAAVAGSLERIPRVESFRAIDSGMSASRDLGYAYGYAETNGRKGYYLRVWGHRHEGWKIILQVQQL